MTGNKYPTETSSSNRNEIQELEWFQPKQFIKIDKHL